MTHWTELDEPRGLPDIVVTIDIRIPPVLQRPAENRVFFTAPPCPSCGLPFDRFEDFRSGVRALLICSRCSNDDLLPRRTPADHCAAEFDRWFKSAATAERVQAYFSGANPEPIPPVSSRPDVDVRGAEARASAPGAGVPSRPVPAPGLLEQCVREAISQLKFTLMAPPTAFQIATYVQSQHPSRWADVSIRKKVSELNASQVLLAVDCDGVSPNGAACFRYELADVQ